MAIKDKSGNWVDAAGNSVPPRYIDRGDKKRDSMIEGLFAKALRQQQALRKFKMQVWDEVSDYLEWLANEHGEEALNAGGNYELKNFRGNKQLIVKVAKVLEFDEKLQVAKQKIDRCLDKWSQGGNENLRTIVFDAFRVDVKGKLDTKRIIGLRSHKIKDKDWQAAMELIADSLTVTGTRQYLLFQHRPLPSDSWKTVRLDLAGCDL